MVLFTPWRERYHHTCDVTRKVERAIREYLSDGHPAPTELRAPLFASNRTDPDTGLPKSLGRTQVWKIIKRDTDAIGLRGGPYSPHSWRKAWGRHALDEGIPMAVIQTKLGHRTPASLLAYLGITREDVRKASEQIEL